jgi:hypothetical protein
VWHLRHSTFGGEIDKNRVCGQIFAFSFYQLKRQNLADGTVRDNHTGQTAADLTRAVTIATRTPFPGDKDRFREAAAGAVPS